MTLVPAFLLRPRLLSAIAVGVATAVILYAIPTENLPSTRAILAWDAGCAWFIASVLWMMRAARTAPTSAARPASQDEGRHMILLVVVVAAAASLWGHRGRAVSGQGRGAGWIESLRAVAFAMVTVAASWFVVQLIFAVHYARTTTTRCRRTANRAGACFPAARRRLLGLSCISR